MIDNKKIKEAARNYCNNRYPASQDVPFIAEGFRKGARWAIHEFLKNLWHPASEEPRRNTICLAQIGKYAFDTFFDSENWVSYSKGVNITRWLYVDDLIPKLNEEDEQ